MGQQLDFARDREAMVARQIEARGTSDAHILAAMREVPREAFVSAGLAEFAYQDTPLPIEAGQTISQPYIVAHMIEEAGVRPGDRVLEVGAGSGYAAAVLSRIAARVHAIERHAELADLASERFARLGYDNIELRTGDGTQGWPDAAPFDAILVAAGGPSVPEPLKRQLALGGRLVLPVGEEGAQKLVRVTRTGDADFRREELGEVRFVPLIGAHGWRDAATEMLIDDKPLPALIRDAAEPLPEIDDAAFARAFDRYAEGARVVLLGEASHGTSEFYRARAAITRRLIERHGFTMVAVEADWPDAAAIDRSVRHKPLRTDEPPFRRFPTWMWRNREFADFVAWLRGHNAARYGRMAITEGYARCESAVVGMLVDLVEKQRDYARADGDDFLDAAQNARLIASAEAYYRVMYYGSAESWNLRDQHMFDTLDVLLRSRAGGKAVVWAHNSHVGDARFTDMGMARGELNLGQLARENYGAEAQLIGFGTHGGTVAAADDWDAPMQVKRVNPSRPDSYERACHDAGVARFLLDLRAERPVRAALLEPRLERFIGVIYRPDTERWSHYSEAILPRQFDGFVWFDETHAVEPLASPERAGGETDETWPFGF